jgi:phosphoribosylformimino-5-aminoimidazole carboxamide ribotide isomerase
MVGIIPVIDVKAGQVVRAVGGRRETYRPIQSVLASDPSPVCVASALAGHLGVDEAYVADLDAIAGGEPSWSDYRTIASAGLGLWVDAGVATAARAQQLVDFRPDAAPLDCIIIGLESIGGPTQLANIVSEVGCERLAFSLDLVDGKPLTDCAAWQSCPAEKIVDAVCAAGIGRMLVLDLARVGMGQGTGTERLCRLLAKSHPELELIAGGGVTSASQILQLADLGCSGVLIGSALHDGRLTRDQLEHAKLIWESTVRRAAGVSPLVAQRLGPSPVS